MSGVTSTMDSNPNVIFVLGPPGSGKGTQSNKIITHYNFAHLSAGDLLREEMSLPTSLHGDVIKKHIDAGTIVPVEITCSLIKKRMDEFCSYGIFNFVVDGFPRNWDNVHGWERMMSSSVNLVFVLCLEAPEDICVERCLSRCDGSGRTDDNMECLKKRINTFKQDTVPIINYYLNKGLVRKVDSGKLQDEVFEDIKDLIQASFQDDPFLKSASQMGISE